MVNELRNANFFHLWVSLNENWHHWRPPIIENSVWLILYDFRQLANTLKFTAQNNNPDSPSCQFTEMRFREILGNQNFNCEHIVYFRIKTSCWKIPFRLIHNSSCFHIQPLKGSSLNLLKSNALQKDAKLRFVIH